MSKPRMTAKQREIVGHILDAADAGRELPYVELKQKLSYTACNAAINCSIETLVFHGIIEKRKTASGRVVLFPTKQAYDFFRPGPLFVT